ncbi:low-density lipoprotein receptor-like isoform X2 [Asterias amurensis]|uniref:low-density lipoprotein receptor-like isoform X2 n=1 Tax=Asterias amurensis TaxID=7602 RepID=UPI003AB72EE2
MSGLYQATCQVMKLVILLFTCNFTLAGDFALIADLFNNSIYAGSMGKALVDLTPLPLSGLKGPLAVDYDPVMEMVYWTEVQGVPSSKIARAHLNGSNQMTLVESLRVPDGLSLDLTSRMMYWTDMVYMHIMRATMDGENKEVIVENIGSPRAIVVHHLSGFIYWTDWGDYPKIERADLDGGNRITLIEGELGWPNGILVDHENNMMYWCDASLDLIERSDLLGEKRQVVKNLTELNLPFHPFDLAVYKDEIYWTDWNYVALLRVNINGLGEQFFGARVFERAAGLHIQLEPDYCESSPCETGATCVDIINGFECLCPPGSAICSQDPSDAGCMFTSDQKDSVTFVPDKDIYQPGEQVVISCPSGYRVSGSIERICRSDLTWSGEATMCIAEESGCIIPRDDSSDIEVIPNKDSYLTGDRVKFSCPNGFLLSSSAEQICLSNSTWSGEQPHCVVDPESEGEEFPLVVGGGAGLFFIIIILVVVVIICVIRSRSRSSNTTNTSSHYDDNHYSNPLAYEDHIEPIYESNFVFKPGTESSPPMTYTTCI